MKKYQELLGRMDNPQPKKARAIPGNGEKNEYEQCSYLGVVRSNISEYADIDFQHIGSRGNSSYFAGTRDGKNYRLIKTFDSYQDYPGWVKTPEDVSKFYSLPIEERLKFFKEEEQECVMEIP